MLVLDNPGFRAETDPTDPLVRSVEESFPTSTFGGFTAIAEGLTPKRVVRLLRGFHRRMANTVFSHGGTIDKYIGDGVMATFGTPRPGKLDAVRAVACALDMAAQIERWNAKRQRRGARPVAIGIGVHYGEVVVGNIGDERRLEYTVIGDTVNLASRIESLTRDLGRPVLVSEAFAAAHGGDFEALGRFTFKGIADERAVLAPR